MKERILLLIWRFFLSEEELKQKKQELLTQKLKYYVDNTTPGGILPFTFWEKVKLIGLLTLMVGISALIFFLLTFTPR